MAEQDRKKKLRKELKDDEEVEKKEIVADDDDSYTPAFQPIFNYEDINKALETRGSRHKPNEESRRLVSSMAAAGVPEEQIARVFRMKKSTLRKFYAEEIDTSSEMATTTVAMNLYNMATNPRGGKAAVTAAIYWMNTKGGWEEGRIDRLEVTGEGGGPIEVKQAKEKVLQNVRKKSRVIDQTPEKNDDADD